MKYEFGSRSKRSLATTHRLLVRVCERVLEYGLIDFAVLEGHRGEEAQNAAFDAGLSQVRYPNGRHNKNPSWAVDVAPYPIDWKDHERFAFLAGLFFRAADECHVRIRWGGDWDSDRSTRDETFRDRGHFELIGDETLT